jgi:DNA-binding NarL/FixJ family response regulator
VTTIRVAVLAAVETVRAGLEALLAAQEGIRVAAPPDPGARGRGPAARVDVLVVAEGRSLEAGRAADPGVPVVCLSDDPDAAGRLARLGLPGWGLLAPTAGAAQIAAAVRAVHGGLVVLGAPLPADAFPARRREEAPRLTRREREVLALLAQGLGNKQIAWELSVSEHTVKYHVSSLYAKLGAGSRTEALRLGIERGLLSV